MKSGNDLLHEARSAMRSLEQLAMHNGTVVDVAVLIRAINERARYAEDARDLREDLARLREQLNGIDAETARAVAKAEARYTAAKSAIGDGVLHLVCGARVLVDGGKPVAISDAGERVDADEALRQLRAIFGEWFSFGLWTDGTAKIFDDDIPF